MKIRGRILGTIAFIEACVRLHSGEARSGIPEIVGALVAKERYSAHEQHLPPRVKRA